VGWTRYRSPFMLALAIKSLKENNMKAGLMIVCIFVLVSCTSVKVTPLDKSYKLSHVCIENNKEVIVKDFLGVVENGFQDRSISTEVYSGEIPKHCKYVLKYTALQSWDMALYLSHAELSLFKDSSRIAYAEYHLRGKGGFSLVKWASVESKMKPVINKLLAQY
jgi:hypothetical protein